MNAGIASRPSHAERTRAYIRQSAKNIGIDESYLSRMVDEFYDRVRADARLGPIFESAIGEDWGPHLRKMKAFWAAVALSAGGYSGRPVPVHRALTDVEPRDFDRWLGLFRATLTDTAPTPEAVSYLDIRAERIAQSLRMAMFDETEAGSPALR